MEQATTALEDGNVELAKKLYEESLGVSEGPNAWFNLGVSYGIHTWWSVACGAATCHVGIVGK